MKQDSEPYTNLNLGSLCATNFWQEAITLAEQNDYQAALDLIRSHPQGAAQLCQRGDSIRKSLKHYLPPTPPPPLSLTRALEDFTYPPLWDPSRVLLIYGPSGLGKTSLLCSLMPTALMVTEPEGMNLFNPKRHGGIIFDDCPLPRERDTLLALLDNTKDRTVTSRKDRLWRCRFKNPFIPSKTLIGISTNYHPGGTLPRLPEIVRRVDVWKAVNQGHFIVDNVWHLTTLVGGNANLL